MEDSWSRDEQAATSNSENSVQSPEPADSGSFATEQDEVFAELMKKCGDSLSPYHSKPEVRAVYVRYLAAALDQYSNWEVLSEKAASDLSTFLSDSEAVSECIEDMFVLFMAKQKRTARYSTVAHMLETYPEFASRSPPEQELLLVFANEMVNCFRHIRPHRNKGRLFKYAIRLSEGFQHRTYTTGGGMTQATRDRLLVFERESDIPRNRRAGSRRRSSTQKEFTPIARAPLDMWSAQEREQFQFGSALLSAHPQLSKPPETGRVQIFTRDTATLQVLATHAIFLEDGYTSVYSWAETDVEQFGEYFDTNWLHVQTLLLKDGWTAIASREFCLVKPNCSAAVTEIASLQGILYFTSKQELKDYLTQKLTRPVDGKANSPALFIEDSYVAVYDWDVSLQRYLRETALQPLAAPVMERVEDLLRQDGWSVALDAKGERVLTKPGYPCVEHEVLENFTFFRSELWLLLYLKEKLRCPQQGRSQRPCLHIADGYNALYKWLPGSQGKFDSLTSYMLENLLQDGWTHRQTPDGELFFKPRGYITPDYSGTPPKWSLHTCAYFDDRRVLLLYLREKAKFLELGKSRSPNVYLSDGYTGIYRWSSFVQLKYDTLWQPRVSTVTIQDLYVNLINDGWLVSQRIFVKPGHDLKVVEDPSLELIAYFTTPEQVLHYLRQKALCPSVGQLTISKQLALADMQLRTCGSAQPVKDLQTQQPGASTEAGTTSTSSGNLSVSMRGTTQLGSLVVRESGTHARPAALPESVLHSLTMAPKQQGLPRPPIGMMTQPHPYAVPILPWHGQPAMGVYPAFYPPTAAAQLAAAASQQQQQQQQQQQPNIPLLSPSAKRQRQAEDSIPRQAVNGFSEDDNTDSEPVAPHVSGSHPPLNNARPALEDDDASIESFSGTEEARPSLTKPAPSGHVRRKRFVPL